MPDEEPNELRQQLDDMVINVRNELIVQTANAVIMGQTAVRASVGLALLGLDEVQAVLSRAVDRGEIAETDTQQAVEALRQQALARAEELDKVRIDMTNKASVALTANVETIMKHLGVTGLLAKVTPKR